MCEYSSESDAQRGSAEYSYRGAVVRMKLLARFAAIGAGKDQTR